LTVRLLHVIHQYLPDHVGGTEHYVQTLASAQQQEGHQVTVFCRQGGTDSRLARERAGEITIYQAIDGALSPARRFRSTLGDRFLDGCLAQAIEESKPDLIHIHHLMGLPTRALLSAGQHIPLFVTLHDYWWVCANAQLYTNYDAQICEGPRAWLNCARCGLARTGMGALWPAAPLLAPVFRLRATTLRRLADNVVIWVAPTSFVADWHVEQGLPRERIQVIGHGIEMPPQMTKTRDATPAGNRKAIRFAYVGGLSPQKGVHILIDAFNGLPEMARLTIAGDESAFPRYTNHLHSQARHPAIQFAGRLDRAAVWQVMANADALVVPSLWYETASLVIQEAFAVGTPVIAADHGAMAERVHHEVDGLLVPPGDSTALRRTMQRLLDNGGLLADLRQGIRPVITISQHLQQIESLYLQACRH
jgi:glycosyltransferase involved in cell wall biosynthesis